VPGRRRPRAGDHRRPPRRGGADRRGQLHGCSPVRAGPTLRDPVPEPDHSAVRHHRDGLGGGRLRASQPRAGARSDRGAGGLGAVAAGHRIPSRARPGAPLRRAGPTRGARLGAGPAATLPCPRRADEPARSARDPAGRRGAGAACGCHTGGDPARRAQDRPARGPRGSRRREVLSDERLEGWGVDPPSRVRLDRAARQAGVALPGGVP